MSSDPAILLYTSDFLTGTCLMNFEQRGKYITLLCLQHQQGHLAREDIINLCGSLDDKILKKFKIDKNGLFYNERMEAEIIKRKNYSASRAKNRKNQIPDNQEGLNHMKNISSSYDNHMENDNEINNGINNEVKNENEINIPFDQFWGIYDKKVGNKKMLLKKWQNLSNQERIDIIEYVPLYKKSTPDKKYRKNPESFLSNKSWNDELIYERPKNKFHSLPSEF